MFRVLLPFGVNPAIQRKLQPYADALRSAGVEPVVVHAEDGRGMGDAAGLLLAGGTDLNPALYGDAAGPEIETPDDDRDDLELRLLSEALERDLPVLAICRGHQLLNVQGGGTLLQHIPSGKHAVRDRPVGDPVHSITLLPGSALARIFGAREVAVNSRHHQAVRDVAPNLRASGWSEDGLVEGLEHPAKRFAIGVQWHPEDQVNVNAQQRRLFEAFAQAL